LTTISGSGTAAPIILGPLDGSATYGSATNVCVSGDFAIDGSATDRSASERSATDGSAIDVQVSDGSISDGPAIGVRGRFDVGPSGLCTGYLGSDLGDGGRIRIILLDLPSGPKYYGRRFTEVAP
jgi:hypothetical protein